MTSFCRNKKSAPAQRRTRIVRLFHRNWCEMVINNRMMSNGKRDAASSETTSLFVCGVFRRIAAIPSVWGKRKSCCYSIFPQFDSDGESIQNETYFLASIHLPNTYFMDYLSTTFDIYSIYFIYLAETVNRYPGPRCVLSFMIRQLASNVSSRSFFFRFSTCPMTSSIPCSMSGWGHITL